MLNTSTAADAATPVPGLCRESIPERLSCRADGSRHNSILAALPEEDYHRLASLLQPVTVEAEQMLSEAATPANSVYFPVSAVLSLRFVLEDGLSSEIATIGHEGIYGASLLADDAIASCIAVVQSAGRAYRGPAAGVAREFQRGGAFQRLVLRHLQTLFMQMAQTSSCNGSHTVEQRTCRWLLGILERGNGNELNVTHEQLACILAVRRESVTATAGRLQDEGAIRYKRGRLIVLARRELERRACACHSVLRNLYARTLNHGPAMVRDIYAAGGRTSFAGAMGVAGAFGSRY